MSFAVSRKGSGGRGGFQLFVHNMTHPPMPMKNTANAFGLASAPHLDQDLELRDAAPERIS